MKIRVPRPSPQTLAEKVKWYGHNHRKHVDGKLCHVDRNPASLSVHVEDPVTQAEPQAILEHGSNDHNLARDGFVAIDRIRNSNRRDRRDSEPTEPEPADAEEPGAASPPRGSRCS